MGPHPHSSNLPSAQSLLAQLTGIKSKLPNKKSSGGEFNALEIQAIWEKALGIPRLDMRLWRQDTCGAYMYRYDYGNVKSKWGWEIDHKYPVAHGGTDVLTNLQALHWENNRRKGDSVTGFTCAITYQAA
jgi:hypothetical protein